MGSEFGKWEAGVAPVSVVMITLNEAHNLEGVLDNLKGWAREVFIVDSCSADETVDIALKYGVTLVQRRFRGFGDQWNFALSELPITSAWTMKLDPDERITDELKRSLAIEMAGEACEGISIDRRLWFMGTILPVSHSILRVWRTGLCRFSDVAVNEHPIVEGRIRSALGWLEHRDSPDLDHWIVKQNRYTTAEAVWQMQGKALAEEPRLFGTSLQRRMWLKKFFWIFPARYQVLYLYHAFVTGAWRAGRVGFVWARLRTEVYRLWEYKRYEIELMGRLPVKIPSGPGVPDSRVKFYI